MCCSTHKYMKCLLNKLMKRKTIFAADGRYVASSVEGKGRGVTHSKNVDKQRQDKQDKTLSNLQ